MLCGYSRFTATSLIVVLGAALVATSALAGPVDPLDPSDTRWSPLGVQKPPEHKRPPVTHTAQETLGDGHAQDVPPPDPPRDFDFCSSISDPCDIEMEPPRFAPAIGPPALRLDMSGEVPGSIGSVPSSAMNPVPGAGAWPLLAAALGLAGRRRRR